MMLGNDGVIHEIKKYVWPKNGTTKNYVILRPTLTIIYLWPFLCYEEGLSHITRQLMLRTNCRGSVLTKTRTWFFLWCYIRYKRFFSSFLAHHSTPPSTLLPEFLCGHFATELQPLEHSRMIAYTSSLGSNILSPIN